MIIISPLADHPNTIPTLAMWFQAQWPAYYASKSQADIELEFQAEANRDGLPLRLIAFESNQLAGTVVLRARAIDSLPAFSPGLGGLFVSESLRGHGIGSKLIRTGMDAARDQGYERLYAATDAAGGILERLGWEQIHKFNHQGELLSLYRFTFIKIC